MLLRKRREPLGVLPACPAKALLLVETLHQLWGSFVQVGIVSNLLSEPAVMLTFLYSSLSFLVPFGELECDEGKRENMLHMKLVA